MSKVNPLGNTGNYKKYKKIFERKKNNEWTSWLKFDSLLKPGKQGVVGLLNFKNKDTKCVFKMSQEVDNLTKHESVVMEGLNEMMAYLPHFCKSFGMVNCKRNPSPIKKENPFDKKSDVKYMIDEEILLQEYIDDSYKFYNYINAANKVEEEVLYSTVKQVLLAISIAQKKKKFSHYDLHSMNIMMKRCNKDVVFVYVIDEENQICVPTLGHYPVIIDYGFSYIENMEDGPLWPTLSHTSSGFFSDRFDNVVDPKLFLVTVSDEINEIRKTKTSRIFRNIVKKIFKPLNIDWETGWDVTKEEDACEEILDIFGRYSNDSLIFSDYPSYCLDLIHSLIILPIENQEAGDLNKSVKTFICEWIKIENKISNPYYNLYILKEIVNHARFIRHAYMEPETSQAAVLDFKNKVLETIDKVAKFVMPSNLNYEKLLCSLYVLCINIESLYYRSLEKRFGKKQKEYSKMPFKNIEQMYAAIDSNIQTNYTFTKETKVFIIDSVKEDTFIFNLKEDEIEKINNTHSFCKGTLLYEIYNNK